MDMDDWDDKYDVEEDERLRPEDIRAVVTDTDWTTETILSQLRRGNIQLNPRFQRRDAWDRTRKSRFVESLMLGLPIPQIVLAEDKNHRGKFIVLDGKQRLLTLRQFAAGSEYDASPGEEIFKTLSLGGLQVRKDLNRATLKKLGEVAQGSDSSDLDSFLNQTIRTVVVRSWPSEDFLNLVFLRLNTGSVSLSPQELRQALHPGPFTDFLDDHSASSASLQKALRINKPDFRMRDVEIMLRFFATHYFLEDYSGNLKVFLDESVNRLNGRWGEESDDIRKTAASCDKAIEATVEIFNENAFSRWSGDKYERPFNRAVFDIMTFYFSHDDIRAAAIDNADEVEHSFRLLCEGDREFAEAIQTTTKTSVATYRRLSLWGATLQGALSRDVHVPVPAFEDNRIIPASR